jgi:hypothetical protein
MRRLREPRDATVQHDREAGKGRLHAQHEIVVERRDLAVLLGAQPFEPGLAGMDRDPRHPRRLEPGEQVGQNRLRILVVDADAALHRDRHRCRRRDHRRRARRDKAGLAHQRRAETARLHPVRGTADIEVDLVKAQIPRDRARRRERLGLRPTELQRQRMLVRMVGKQPIPRPVQDRAGRDHLGIEQRPPREGTVEHPAMPVGPVHHRGDG